MAFTAVPLFANNDGADQSRLNAMISNLNFLNDSKVRVNYNAYGVQRSDGMKIACGTADADSPNTMFRLRWVAAGNFFTPGTRPVCVVTLATLRVRRSTIAIAQRTGESIIPDHTGFQAYARFIFETGNPPYGPNFIHWIMMGY
jgi:hypothetical protein